MDEILKLMDKAPPSPPQKKNRRQEKLKSCKELMIPSTVNYADIVKLSCRDLMKEVEVRISHSRL